MSDVITFHIKNMVCERCIRVVREELRKIGIEICHIELGKVEIEQNVNELEYNKIRQVLSDNGFGLLEDKKAKLIEEVKNLIILIVHKAEDEQSSKLNYSEFLSNNLSIDYHYLSTLFSSVENITIEHYIILQKIERAKELLKYNEETLSEIAYNLGYSSVQHLSTQFKKVTGMTAGQFRNMTTNLRKPIDKVY